MDDPVLQFVTRGVFVLIFGFAALDVARHRDLPRLEVAALFGGLTLVIILQLAQVARLSVPSGGLERR